MLISYASSFLLPLNLQKLTDRVIMAKEYNLVSTIILSYACIWIISTLASYFFYSTWRILYNDYVVGIKKALFLKIMQADTSTLQDYSSGDLMTRIDNDSDQFLHAVIKNFFHLINSIIYCLAIVYFIINIDLFLGFFVLLSSILPIVASRFFAPKSEQYYAEHKSLYGVFTGYLMEVFTQIKKLILANSARTVQTKIESVLSKFIILGNKIKRINFFAEKTIYAFNLLTSIIIYSLALNLIPKGAMTVGEFIAVISFMALLHKKLNWLLRIMLDWKGRKYSIERVSDILKIPCENTKGNTIDKIDKFAVTNVSFGYNNDIVLRNISFSIENGDILGIVGMSGVGKTTLIGLLLKLYTPNKGSILVNDIDYNDLSSRCLRDRCCVVSQEIILFDTSLRYNLTLGKNISEDTIWDVLSLVDLKETIMSLPGALDYVFCRQGDLSTGQKQRLMVARAILKNSDVYFLDEATSAIDTKHEKNLLDAMVEKNIVKTAIIISHRYEAIKYCNKVIVLKDGCIESCGSIAELKKCSPTFNELFREMF